jgi:hypothetical protein
MFPSQNTQFLETMPMAYMFGRGHRERAPQSPARPLTVQQRSGPSEMGNTRAATCHQSPGATVGSLNLENEPIQWLAYGILLSSGWPVWSATTRRLRDTGLNPWYGLLLIAIPSAIQIGALLFSSAALVMGITAAAITIGGVIFLGVLPSKR